MKIEKPMCNRIIGDRPNRKRDVGGGEMREILFKGKRVDNGGWIEGLPYKAKYGGISSIVDNDEERHLIIPETLCEFTGLCDRNGKRIWENDIVNIEYPETTVKNCIIEYVGASFIGSTHADNWELDGYYDIEVIGNIFDDSKLLTAERIGENEN